VPLLSRKAAAKLFEGLMTPPKLLLPDDLLKPMASIAAGFRRCDPECDCDDVEDIGLAVIKFLYRLYIAGEKKRR